MSQSGLDRFVFGVAQRLHVAFGAFWFARDANAAAVPDNLMRELDPFILWNYLHQVLLDFLGVFVAG